MAPRSRFSKMQCRAHLGRTAHGECLLLCGRHTESACYFADGTRRVPATLRTAHGECLLLCGRHTESACYFADGTRRVPAALENRQCSNCSTRKRKQPFQQAPSCPHWFQPGVTYFVTFRSEDSIPAGGENCNTRRCDWLQEHGIHPGEANWKAALERLPREAQREFHKTFSRQYLSSWTADWGPGFWRARALAKVVADSLLHFDGDRYQMGDFIVMPNHTLC